ENIDFLLFRRRGNTALHECCLLGANGIEPLGILLKLGGDASWLNDKNENVVDLASKQSCPELFQVIAKYRANKIINQPMKSSYDDHARTTTVHGYRSSEKS
ncbi:unnamed protein product, partial [Rotaria sp. Silwood2]